MSSTNFEVTDHCPIEPIFSELSEQTIRETRMSCELALRGWTIYSECFSIQEVNEIKDEFNRQLILPKTKPSTFRSSEVINSCRSRASILSFTNPTLLSTFSSLLYNKEDSELISSITNMDYVPKDYPLPSKPLYKIYQDFESPTINYIGLINFSDNRRITLYDDSHRHLSKILLNIFNSKNVLVNPDVNTINLLVQNRKIFESNPYLYAGDVIIFDARLTLKIEQENECLSKIVSYISRNPKYSEALSNKRKRYFHSGITSKAVVHPLIIDSIPNLKKFSLSSSIESINDEDDKLISKLF